MIYLMFLLTDALNFLFTGKFFLIDFSFCFFNSSLSDFAFARIGTFCSATEDDKILAMTLARPFEAEREALSKRINAQLPMDKVH